MKNIRTSRTLSVKDQQLSPEQMAMLSSLKSDPRYEALLDVMERACIEQETALINCQVEQADRILAEHTLSKAMWMVFTYVQRQVENAYQQRVGRVVEVEEVDPDEKERRQILGT